MMVMSDENSIFPRYANTMLDMDIRARIRKHYSHLSYHYFYTDVFNVNLIKCDT